MPSVFLNPSDPQSQEIPRERIPRHVAMIMDGNGRWAQQNSLPRIEGHRRGSKAINDVVLECKRLGIEQVTLYCFSSENWKRPEEEVEFLIQLFQQFLIESRSILQEHEIRLEIIGRRDGISEEALREMEQTLQLTEHYKDFCLCLAVNYGGRQEIVDAVRQISEKVAQGELSAASIDEETVANHLYTAGAPDPDLLIRTAGEMRVSNYLLWQISYAELWVTERYWPEFQVADLHDAIRSYACRQRRFGGITD